MEDSVIIIKMALCMLQRAVGPSGATRTRGFLLPKQAPYQLGYTRICLRYAVTLPT